MKQDMFNAWLPEQFKEHPDFPGIWVSNCGTILSTRKPHGCKPMDPYGAEPRLIKVYGFHGYLYTSGFGSVHRLVAQTWIPNPNNFSDVNHKDEDKLNNTIVLNDDLSVNLELSNLEWCTHGYNCNYGTRNARQSASMKGKEPWNKGIPHSTETRAKMSASHKGHKGNNRSGKNLYLCPDGKKRYYFPDKARELGLI